VTVPSRLKTHIRAFNLDKIKFRKFYITSCVAIISRNVSFF